MLDLDLTLSCDICSRSPAQLRINGRTICAPCGREVINRAAGPAPTIDTRSPEDRILEFLRHGPAPRPYLRRRCGVRPDKADAAIERLLAAGRVELRQDGASLSGRSRTVLALRGHATRRVPTEMMPALAAAAA